MATTITLASSINWAQAYGGFRSLTIGAANEPAATCANIIHQTIISPPFSWNWNRASVSFLTLEGVQDYVKSAQNFGFIEKASYVSAASVTQTSLTSNVATYVANNNFTAGDRVTVTGTQNDTGAFEIFNEVIASATAIQFTVNITHLDIPTASDVGTAISGDVVEIPNIQDILGSGNEPGSPAFIAPQIDDNRNNITFRILPVPDQTYQVNVIFQKKIPSLITGPLSTWAPIPDHYSVIYQWGFLALVAAYFGDPRWASFSQKFVAALLGMSEGLDEEQRNIFETAWLDMISERQAAGYKTQQGVSARTI